MEMDLDQVLVTHGQKAVALQIGGDVVENGVLVQVMSVDEQLSVKLEFQHGFLSFSQFLYFACAQVFPVCTSATSGTCSVHTCSMHSCRSLDALSTSSSGHSSISSSCT